MSKINVVVGDTIIEVSGNKSEEEISSIVINRQKIAHDYCVKMGWPTNPEELSFSQILAIRALPEWKTVTP